MKLERNIIFRTNGRRADSIKKMLCFSLSIVLCLVSFCGCSSSATEDSLDIFTSSSAASTTTELAIQTSSTSETSEVDQKRIALQELHHSISLYGYTAIFYDIDLDGDLELLFGASSLYTYGYFIYELGGDVPVSTGEIFVVGNSGPETEYLKFTTCEGKFKRYYDKKQNQYFMISENFAIYTEGDYYQAYKQTFANDNIISEALVDFGGSVCDSADNYKHYLNKEEKYVDVANYLHYDSVSFLNKTSTHIGLFDLNGEEKFCPEFEDYIKQYEYVDTINFDEQKKYTDADEIIDLIISYSSEIDPPNISTDEENTYNFMGNNFAVNSTSVHFDVSYAENNILSELKKFTYLYSLYLYGGYDGKILDIDFSPLKECKNLRFLSVPENLSEKSKAQLKELTQLTSLSFSSEALTEDEYNFYADFPKLKSISLLAENDEPDCFSYLYGDKNIIHVHFYEATDEQIENVIKNLPNIKSIAFGYSVV